MLCFNFLRIFGDVHRPVAMPLLRLFPLNFASLGFTPSSMSSASVLISIFWGNNNKQMEHKYSRTFANEFRDYLYDEPNQLMNLDHFLTDVAELALLFLNFIGHKILMCFKG